LEKLILGQKAGRNLPGRAGEAAMKNAGKREKQAVGSVFVNQ
jgi:hypothetical protein